MRAISESWLAPLRGDGALLLGLFKQSRVNFCCGNDFKLASGAGGVKLFPGAPHAAASVAGFWSRGDSPPEMRLYVPFLNS